MEIEDAGVLYGGFSFVTKRTCTFLEDSSTAPPSPSISIFEFVRETGDRKHGGTWRRKNC